MCIRGLQILRQSQRSERTIPYLLLSLSFANDSMVFSTQILPNTMGISSLIAQNLHEVVPAAIFFICPRDMPYLGL